MKKVLTLLALVFLLTSCATTIQLKELQYDGHYQYKIFDGVLGQFYYTNKITFKECAVIFLDHNGNQRILSEYSIENLNTFGGAF